MIYDTGIRVFFCCGSIYMVTYDNELNKRKEKKILFSFIQG